MNIEMSRPVLLAQGNKSKFRGFTELDSQNQTVFQNAQREIREKLEEAGVEDKDKADDLAYKITLEGYNNDAFDVSDGDLSFTSSEIQAAISDLNSNDLDHSGLPKKEWLRNTLAQEEIDLNYDPMTLDPIIKNN